MHRLIDNYNDAISSGPIFLNILQYNFDSHNENLKIWGKNLCSHKKVYLDIVSSSQSKSFSNRVIAAVFVCIPRFPQNKDDACSDDMKSSTHIIAPLSVYHSCVHRVRQFYLQCIARF